MKGFQTVPMYSFQNAGELRDFLIANQVAFDEQECRHVAIDPQPNVPPMYAPIREFVEYLSEVNRALSSSPFQRRVLLSVREAKADLTIRSAAARRVPPPADAASRLFTFLLAKLRQSSGVRSFEMIQPQLDAYGGI